MKKYNNGELRLKDINKEITVYGWVNKRRDMGGVIFVDLRDKSGILQIVFNREYLKDNFELAEDLKNEYCIEVTGTLSKRTESEINPNLKTGDIELIASNLTILSKSGSLPFNIYEDKEINEQISLKYRYLDLRRDKLKNIMILRHKINKAFRSYLDNNDYIDFETPILCKSTPEGARDYLVPSRINKGSFYALPQSPQIFKQVLMISGFEKYYQIAKCFRDEDLRADRQPEFTQVDIEMSFVNQEDILSMSEELIKYVVKQSINKDITYKFPRLTYREAMNKYGCDKPDTRFGLELQDLTEILKNTSMNVFANAINNGGIAKGLVVKENKYSRNEIDRLTEFVKIYGAKGLAWLKYDNNEFTGVIAKNLEIEIQDTIKKELMVENGDLVLIVCGIPKIVFASLAALRLKIANDFNLIDKSKLNFMFITDFPMFEYSETEKRYMATHHPFTKPESIEKLNKPEECLSVAYDIVLNGYEIGGGSIRIHNQKMQHEVFKALGISEIDAKEKFGFFLEALKYGTPPHGGIAFGLDRIVMLLSGTDNIKDVIAFPKTQTAADLMCEAPSDVDAMQLKDLGINIIKDGKNES
ncbi:MAG: aspartate--tRNA ligase [Bacilli bacterium]|nr:aspartate--tRNA ligase [Bacilli bacterium]MDD3895472.1 aspartate--tRNA ligase [Bacilli bacterium]